MDAKGQSSGVWTPKDSWRTEVGFSPNVQRSLNETLAPGASDQVVKRTLADWLGANQPCLFGRIAAKQDLVEYCILREDDLRASDELVHDKIHQARLRWYRRGWDGSASAFVIAVLSKDLAYGLPGHIVQEIARRLCFLYLDREIRVNDVYLDQLYLEIPNKERSAWKWVAGVNYFSAQADKRWWQDHRIPVGMAFSVNSVGHMVKSQRLVDALLHLEQILDHMPADFQNHRVDSLEKALEMAMRTIDKASDAVSGKATKLIPRTPEDGDLPLRCPIPLPASLQGKNHCEYEGLYHTDITLPQEFFFPSIERPTDLPIHRLDFTYLFDRSLNNPDHLMAGVGLQIRETATAEDVQGIASYRFEKGRRGIEAEVAVENEPLLREALGI